MTPQISADRARYLAERASLAASCIEEINDHFQTVANVVWGIHGLRECAAKLRGQAKEADDRLEALSTDIATALNHSADDFDEQNYCRDLANMLIKQGWSKP